MCYRQDTGKCYLLMCSSEDRLFAFYSAFSSPAFPFHDAYSVLASFPKQLCLSLAVRTCRSNMDTVAFFDSGSAFSLDRARVLQDAPLRPQPKPASLTGSSPVNEQAIAKALYGADETDQAWEADLQRLRVYPLADANNLLWVRMGRACALRRQGRKTDTPRMSTLRTGLTHLIPFRCFTSHRNSSG